MMKRSYIFLLPIIFGQILAIFSSFSIQAQTQDFDFSANNPECVAYQCLGADGNVDSSIKPQWKTEGSDSTRGKCICPTGLAVLKPPKLQQLQIWFYRVLYAIWGLVAGFSFLMLVYLGYRYMLRGGTSDQELVKLRKDILNYVIGFALVFLAVPILSTVFRLMQINDDVQCYRVNMPGFQFFFEDLCTDPIGTTEAQCKNLESDLGTNFKVGDLSGIYCANNGDTLTCNFGNGGTGASSTVRFVCSGNYWQIANVSL
jgi:hypothetical protein